MRWKASFATTGEAVIPSRREDSGKSPALGGILKNIDTKLTQPLSPRQHQFGAQAAERRGAELELAAVKGGEFNDD